MQASQAGKVPDTVPAKGHNVVVVGTQWGDEGKGKVVDWLTDHAQAVPASARTSTLERQAPIVNT